jgi:hypothetical protein
MCDIDKGFIDRSFSEVVFEKLVRQCDVTRDPQVDQCDPNFPGDSCWANQLDKRRSNFTLGRRQRLVNG